MKRLLAEPTVAAAVRLDPLGEHDAEELAAVLADPGLHAFTGGRPADLEQLRERHRRMLAGPHKPGEWWLNWIVRTADGAAVGTVQATVVDRPDGRRATVAWVIGVPWQGRGHGSQAAAAMVAWLRANGAARVGAHIQPGHRASERVAAGCGLAPTAGSAGGERVWQLSAS